MGINIIDREIYRTLGNARKSWFWYFNKIHKYLNKRIYALDTGTFLIYLFFLCLAVSFLKSCSRIQQGTRTFGIQTLLKVSKFLFSNHLLRNDLVWCRYILVSQSLFNGTNNSNSRNLFTFLLLFLSQRTSSPKCFKN